MVNWGSWHDISLAKKLEQGRFGIYQIRLADKNNKPIVVRRFGGLDLEGIIYIGRSGDPAARGNRSLGQRIWEFEDARHSGGILWAVMQEYCSLSPGILIKDFKLQYRTKEISGSKEDIQEMEVEALAEYFMMWDELPPCNSRFEDWKKFVQILPRPQRSES